jgi:hypothetical protein
LYLSLTGAECEVFISEIGVDLDQGGGSGVVCELLQVEMAGGGQRQLVDQQRNNSLGGFFHRIKRKQNKK